MTEHCEKFNKMLIDGLVDNVTGDYVLLGLPKHMNLGDTLIWAAECDLLESVNYKCKKMYFFGERPENIDINDDDIILFSGGGSLCDIWSTDLYIKLIAKTFGKNKLILLPNSIWFDNPDREESLIKTLNNRGGKTILCCREQQSFDNAMKNYSSESVTVLLLPDVVLGWDLMNFIQKYNLTITNCDDKTLYISRNDREKRGNVKVESDFTSDWPTILNIPKYCDYKLSAIDWKNNVVPKLVAESINFISKYRNVYSDRMHGAILSWLLGRQTTFINNSYGKTKSLFETWFNGVDGVTLMYEYDNSFYNKDATNKENLNSFICANLTYDDCKVAVDFMNKIGLFKDYDQSNDSFYIRKIITDIKNKDYTQVYFVKKCLASLQMEIELDRSNKKNDDIISFIIVNRGGTQISRVVKNINETYKNENKEIIVVTQDDDELFKRGQLFNVAVKKATGKYIALMDNDIVSLSYVNLIETYKKSKSPFVLFDKLTQVSYDENENLKKTSTIICCDGFGAFLFMEKDDFVKKNGYSNLCLGWGAEDNISDERFNIKRIDNEIGHITHEVRYNKNPKNTEINREVLWRYYRGELDASKDGYVQTACDYVRDEVKDGIRYIDVKNITVCDGFEYMDYLDRHNAALPVKENVAIIAPSATIIIPLYNAEKYVEDAIDSVKAQTFKNWECIIVNDGSTDNSEEIVLKAIKGDNRFTYVTGKNRGAAGARNIALRLARGKYICPLDADDMYMNYYVELAVDYMEKHPECTVYYGAMINFGAGGSYVAGYTNYKDYATLTKQNSIPCFGVYRRKDAMLINGYNEKIRGYEDWDFWLRLLYKDKVVYKNTGIVYLYRHFGNQKHDIDKKNAKETIRELIDANKEIFKEYGIV